MTARWVGAAKKLLWLAVAVAGLPASVVVTWHAVETYALMLGLMLGIKPTPALLRSATHLPMWAVVSAAAYLTAWATYLFKIRRVA